MRFPCQVLHMENGLCYSMGNLEGRAFMPDNNDKYILQSVSNTLDILDFLAQHKNMSVPEIAEGTGFGKSSVFRILATLETKSFVKKSMDARYSLDVKLAYLGQAAMDQDNLIKYGHPYLEALTNTSGETSHLAVSYQSVYVRFIDKVVSRATIRMDSRPGYFRHSHYVACGKILLAYGSEFVRENYMQTVPLTPRTKHCITTRETLLSELDMIKKNGYALDREESEYGLTCVAAPISDFTGQVTAAVSISGPTFRMVEHMEQNISLVVDTGKAITKMLCSLVPEYSPDK